jgi:ATP:ADP antiporter, AAA family
MSGTSSKKREFGSLRSFFWPVHRNELRKLLPMMLLCFLITFNYNMLRNSKDAIVVTAKLSGAEIIPFIKVWILLPMAIGITYIFAKLSNKFDRESVFYWMISIFLGFFFIFTFILFPMREHLHLDSIADRLQLILPKGMRGLVAMIRYWSFTCYYVMSELWGTAIFSVAFWGFANEVTKVKEAKRFYGLIAISANFSGIISGFVGIYLSRNAANILGGSFGGHVWHQSLVLITVCVLAAGSLSLIVYKKINRELSDSGDQYQKIKKSKVKMSMRENFALLGKNSYLRNIAIIVVAYNLTINLVEIIWKDQIKMLYPSAIGFHTYMNQVSIGIGIVATIGAFISGKLIRKIGWSLTAMLTPALLLTTSFAFFSALFLKDYLGFITEIFTGVTPLMVIVFFGSMQNVFLRGCKFTVFDNTKELAFIPLKREDKLRGKAAIDGVGSRFGKSGGSIIHQGLLMFLESIAASAVFVAGFLAISGVSWLFSVKRLGKQFNDLTQETPQDEERMSAKETKDAAIISSPIMEEQEVSSV